MSYLLFNTSFKNAKLLFNNMRAASYAHVIQPQTVRQPALVPLFLRLTTGNAVIV
jgi:hypothetical protein